METDGLRCAPEILPKDMITAITIMPGATTAVTRLTDPGSAIPIMGGKKASPLLIWVSERLEGFVEVSNGTHLGTLHPYGVIEAPLGERRLI